MQADHRSIVVNVDREQLTFSPLPFDMFRNNLLNIIQKRNSSTKEKRAEAAT
jgi:hypothetical protein